MTSTHHRSYRTVLIPWVITLVALVGLNALVPNHARSRKTDAPETASLSQLTDDAQTPSRVSKLPVLLASHASEAGRPTNLTWHLLCLEAHRQQAPLQARGGSVRGRAPPARQLA